MAKYSGKKARVLVGSTPIGVTSWSADEVADDTDSTDTEASGFKEQVLGNQQLTGRLTGFYNSAQKPSATPKLTAGNQLSNLVLYLSTATTCVTIPLVDITGFAVNQEVRGVITFTVTWKSNGSYTWS